MSAVRTHRWTRDAYERLGEEGMIAPDERVELIDGELINMAPQSSLHYTAIRNVETALRQIFGGGFELRVQGPLALSDIDEPEPDVAVVEGSIDDYRDAHPTTAVLVVEVADSSLEFDRTKKAAVYARAEISDYWIVNLVDAQVEVYRDPDGEMFGWKRTFRAGDSVSPQAHAEASIAVDDLLP